jgi:hypothetical protein
MPLKEHVTWVGDGSAAPLRTGPFSRRASLVVALGLVAGYALLLVWFERVDFYRSGFFVHGLAVTRYEFARLIFVPYLAWLIYAVGAAANFLVFGRKATAELPYWERVPLFFIVGAGIWHVPMFAIGLAGLDRKPVALALTLGAISLSVPHLAGCVEEAFNRALRWRRRQVDLELLAAAALCLCILAATIMFLLVKGLYPGGGHDYYKHYFQFYKRVVDTGSVLPNEVWYHFYYSKGAGLYFLGMLLTDPLAPQLVATVFVGCGAWIVYALLYKACPSKLLPLTGVLLYIVAYVPTGSDVVLGEQRGKAWVGWIEWGILERLHELTAVLLLAVIWIAYRLFRKEVSGRGVWVFALHASIITIVLLTLPLALLIGLFMAGYLVWFALSRQWHLMLQPLAAGITAGLSLLVIAALNYHYTGFPSDIVLDRFWPYADLMKIMHWGTMLEILMLYQDGPYLVVAAQPISWSLMTDLAAFLRLNLWWPIFLAAIPFILFRISKSARRWLHARDVDPYVWVALGLFSAAVILVAIFGGGRSQPISFYRLSTFSYAPTLCLGLLLCRRGLPEAASGKKRTMLGLVPISGMLTIALGAILASSPNTISTMRWNVSAVLEDAARLLVGRFSLLDAYQNQPAGLAPWGAIYPGII